MVASPGRRWGHSCGGRVGRPLGFCASVRRPSLAGVGSGGHRELPHRPRRWHPVLQPVSLLPLPTGLASGASLSCAQFPSPCKGSRPTLVAWGWMATTGPGSLARFGSLVLSTGSQAFPSAPEMACHWAPLSRTCPGAWAWPTSQPSASPSRSPWPSTLAVVPCDILLGRSLLTAWKLSKQG